MKIKICFRYLSITLALLAGVRQAAAQGTLFTYQGRLNTNTVPANGFFDFQFSLYANSAGTGIPVAGPITQTAIGVTNGLFTTTLNFGAVFTGNATWLAISARSNGVGTYTGLTPLQELTPTPYAITAENLDGTLPASQLSGTLPAGLLSGTYGGVLNLNNGSDSFTGNGAGLANVNALTLDGLGANSFWNLLGNTGTTPGVNFLGTTDNEALEVHVNGVRGLRIEPDTAFNTPNVIGGSSANYVIPGSVGNFIGAGGQAGIASNIITGQNLNVIGGGWNNHITNGYENVIAGGEYNTVGSANAGGIGGGDANTVTGSYATVPGGYNNQATGIYSFAAGQSAQALHNGAFVWADDSSASAFTSTAANQFLIRSSFVGINRTSPIVGDDWLDVHAPVTNTWGGMYMETAGLGQPFYGYAMGGGVYAYTWLNGSSGGNNSWNVYDAGGTLTLTPGGQLGVNLGFAVSPSQALEVNGEFMMVDGLGGVKCYIGDDGFGNDVQIGSLKSGVTAVACYNAADSAYMHLYCSSITIEGGADLAEPFPISKPDQNKAISPGSVVVIDDQNPGQLRLSDQPYDTRVAGVVSGANGINPGIQMQQQGLLEGGKNVALTGRVYVLADAAGGAIKPGDLLTTSSTPGHAMKVSDHARASGAILGKAMSGLQQGKGSVLVLVTLQ
jgi:hypothetical protein